MLGRCALALKNKQIDGSVVDLLFYVTAVQVPGSKILGQFENRGKATDRFGVAKSLTAAWSKAISFAMQAPSGSRSCG